jgi:RNA polymerase sigma-70 factor, ECF subfamily
MNCDPSGETDSQTLMERAKGGDQAALNELLGLFRPVLRSFAERVIAGRLARRMDVSDLVQDTLWEAYQALGPDFRGESEAELQRWLQQILQSNYVDAFRRHVLAIRRSVTAEVAIDDLSSPARIQMAYDSLSPSQHVARNEEEQRLRAAVAQLPPDQSRAVQLFYFEKRPLEEVRAALDKPTANAVSQLLRRAMEKLRSLLREKPSP